VQSNKDAPATVAQRSNLGWTIKYKLRFDDDVVRCSWRPAVLMGCSPTGVGP
jgi:hypothetical protein